MTLRARLALAAAGTAALVVLGICLASFFLLRYELYHQLDLALTQSATAARQHSAAEPPGVVSGECAYLAAPACTQIVPASAAQDPRGSAYLLPVTPAVRQVAAGLRPAYYANIDYAGYPARMLVTHLGDGRALQVALRADGAQRAAGDAAALLAGLGGAGILLSAGLGLWVSRRGLRPVARFTATAERITATRDPALRIDAPPGPARDEVTRLTASFNSMLDALEQSVTAQRRLVADASHELRTPLTALRTNAELLADERLTPQQRRRAADAQGRQVREVIQLVNDLIELARDEEPAALVEQVSLAELAAQAVGQAREHWPAVRFTFELNDAGDDAGIDAGGALVAGVPARLERLLSNLLDNAAKFSPPGGPVETVVTGTEITVRDHGPGIEAADLPYVFDRFYRASAARALPGSGLGLAMARQIARAHGAELTAEPAPGSGSLFRLHLPPARHD